MSYLLLLAMTLIYLMTWWWFITHRWNIAELFNGYGCFSSAIPPTLLLTYWVKFHISDSIFFSRIAMACFKFLVLFRQVGLFKQIWSEVRHAVLQLTCVSFPIVVNQLFIILWSFQYPLHIENSTIHFYITPWETDKAWVYIVWTWSFLILHLFYFQSDIHYHAWILSKY